MEIARQHETTTINELSGAECTRVLGVGPAHELGPLFCYIQAGGEWYRFYIQQGILFWITTEPDPEDDLGEGEEYADILEDAGVNKSLIESIEMGDGCLTITFATGQRLTFREVSERGGMAVS